MWKQQMVQQKVRPSWRKRTDWSRFTGETLQFGAEGVKIRGKKRHHHTTMRGQKQQGEDRSSDERTEAVMRRQNQ